MSRALSLLCLLFVLGCNHDVDALQQPDGAARGDDAGAMTDAQPPPDAPTDASTSDAAPDAGGGPGCECVRKVSTGRDHSCALTVGGNVLCWGWNELGQAAPGRASPFIVPTRIGTTGGALDVAAGGGHSCLITATRTVQCWGDNTHEELGAPAGPSSRIEQVPMITTALEVDLGYWHSCARLMDDTLRCWGQNFSGELGNGDDMNTYDVPRTVMGVAVSGMRSLRRRWSSGGGPNCAITGDGLRCWGYGAFGALGTANEDNQLVPVPVGGVPAPIQQVSAGGSPDRDDMGHGGHTCVLASGEVHCWGRNDDGQVDTAVPMRSAFAPVQAMVPRAGIDIVEVAAGGRHTCLVTDDGAVWCWGANDHGQVGNGTALGPVAPNMASRQPLGATQIDAGADHTCVIDARGNVLCWGWNDRGQVGRRPMPMQMVFPEAVSVPIPSTVE